MGYPGNLEMEVMILIQILLVLLGPQVVLMQALQVVLLTPQKGEVVGILVMDLKPLGHMVLMTI